MSDPNERSAWGRVRDVFVAGSKATNHTFGFIRGGRSERDQDAAFEQVGLPAPDRSAGLGMHALADHAALAAFAMVRRIGTHEDWVRRRRDAQRLADAFADLGVDRDPLLIHPEPPAADRTRHRRTYATGMVFDRLTFASEWECPVGGPVVAPWNEGGANRIAVVNLLHSDDSAPWLVCVHGAEGGRSGIDARLFDAARLQRELGCNVALPVLPLHGRRRQDLDPSIRYPALDPVVNVYAAAQSIWDLRRLLGWIRQLSDAPIAVMGFSLGGYTAALLASVVVLDGVIAHSPATDLVTLIQRHLPREVRADDDVAAVFSLARTVTRPVSPLALDPLTAFDRRFVLGGLGDRLAHPVEQVAALWEHWGRPAAHWYPGGHLGHRRVRSATEFVDRALRTSFGIDPEAEASLTE